MRVIRTPIRAPNANAYAERVIETSRQDAPDGGPTNLHPYTLTYAADVDLVVRDA